MNEMRLKVQEITLPDIIKFNYEELKAEIETRCEYYETAIYTEANIRQAKDDKAMLNKLKKALNDERIRREKEYMQPFNDFKAKVNELIGIIDKPVGIIDSQVKAFEEQQKAFKKAEIETYWMEQVDAEKIHPELTLEMIFDSKWLNASVALSKVKEEINFAADNFKANIQILENLPEFAFEAKQTYISTLDLQKAIAEANRLAEMAKKKAAAEELKKALEEEKAEAAKRAAEEAQVVEEVPEEKVVIEIKVPEEKQMLYIRIKVTEAQKKAFMDFAAANDIEYSIV